MNKHKIKDVLEVIARAADWADDLEHLGPFHKDPYWSKMYMIARIMGAPKEDAPQMAFNIHLFIQKIASSHEKNLNQNI